MTQFKDYIIVEQKQFLNDRISPIVNAINTLQSDMPNVGSKQIIKSITNIADEIRKILNDDWPDSEQNTLKTLQTIAFFLLKSVDTNDDLKNVIDTAATALYTLSGVNKVQPNNL